MKAIIYKNVVMGEGSIIEENCIIGKPPKGKVDGVFRIVIGKNAHIRSGSVIYADSTIGDNFQTGHNVLIREGNKIGDNVSVGTGSCIEVDNVIGNDVRIHSLCFLEKVTIEDMVFIGPNVTFLDDPHPKIPKAEDCMKGAHVEKHVKIGGNATILPYVVIGEGAFVGAGSVVTKAVVAESVVVGNPAKVHKRIKDIICKKNGKVHSPYE